MNAEKVSLHNFWRQPPPFSEPPARKQVIVVAMNKLDVARVATVSSVTPESDEKETKKTKKVIDSGRIRTATSCWKSRRFSLERSSFSDAMLEKRTLALSLVIFPVLRNPKSMSLLS